jgi:hypothetical protein
MESDILAAALKEHRRGPKKSHELIDVLKEQDGDAETFPTSTANEYLPKLTSLTYERLLKQPVLLQSEIDRTEEEVKDLAVSNYGAFIGTSRAIQNISKQMDTVQNLVTKLDDSFAPAAKACDEFREKGLAIQKKRTALKNVATQQMTLVDLLEIPMQLDACIRNQFFDETLDLLGFTSTMFHSYTLRAEQVDGDNTLPDMITQLKKQVDVQREHLKTALLTQLRGDVHLPACVKVVHYLRRLGGETENSLKEIFLENRRLFLKQHKDQIDSQLASVATAPAALRHAADYLRTHVFDIATQYKTLFRSEDDRMLAYFLMNEVYWFMDRLEDNTLPRVLGHPTLSNLRVDASAIVQIVRQMYTSSATLRRLGAEFAPACLPTVNRHMEAYLKELCNKALEDFQVELERYDWIPSTALASTAASTDASQGDWLVPNALELCRHRPLAVLTNSLILVCNELRQCALYHIRHNVLIIIRDALISVVGVMRSVHQAPGRYILESFCFCFFPVGGCAYSTSIIIVNAWSNSSEDAAF